MNKLTKTVVQVSSSLLGIFVIVVIAFNSYLGSDKKLHMKAPLECGNIIEINKDGLPEDWESKNSNFLATPQAPGNVPSPPNTPIPPPVILLCEAEHFYIDISRIIRFGVGDYPLVDWLKDNRKYICYKNTYNLIECEHIITKQSEIGIITQFPVRKSLTLAEIKSEFLEEGLDFETEDYRHYMDLSIRWLFGYSIHFDFVDGFDSEKSCFSAPLFQSIVRNYQLDDNSKFEFRKVKIVNPQTGETDRKVVFSVQVRPGIYNHYNFSQVPHAQPGRVNEYSPL